MKRRAFSIAKHFLIDLSLTSTDCNTSTAIAYYIELGGTYTYRVSDRFSLVGNLGYQVNTGGQIESQEDDPLYYINNDREINWTGLKLHAGITYRFR